MMKTLVELSAKLKNQEVKSVDLTKECLDKIMDISSEGSRVFLRDYSRQANAAAEVSDRMRAHGRTLSPIDGIPVSIKDLFDVKDEDTLAGSMVRTGCNPADDNSYVVNRLREAGAVIVGRTNMSEFAFSGVGTNPHYGTPLNPYDRKSGRIPGGSSSGAAVAVADQMCFASICSDTGGSARIPAALCGLTGFKPTKKRIPCDGMFPLSKTLDSVGVIAASTSCCMIMDSILCPEKQEPIKPFPIAGLRLAIPQNIMLDDLSDEVAAVFEKTISYLSKNGAVITEIPMEELSRITEFNKSGGIVSAEAFAVHRNMMAKHSAGYDPKVLVRIEQGVHFSAHDYIDLLEERDNLIKKANKNTFEFDALIMPTVPIAAPRVDDVVDSVEYRRINRLLLRNTCVWNALDRCAISLPCHNQGEVPVGLMLVGETMGDRKLFAVALGVEMVLNLMRDI
ncbi:MAG: amidase [Alphaproteobacteria bacterium]